MTDVFLKVTPPDAGYILKSFEAASGDIFFDWILTERYDAENPIRNSEDVSARSDAVESIRSGTERGD